MKLSSLLSTAVDNVLTVDQMHLTDRLLDELHKIDQTELMQICESEDLLKQKILYTAEFLS